MPSAALAENGPFFDIFPNFPALHSIGARLWQ
jgi:hypothetical protein